jgi:hypothetical protein
MKAGNKLESAIAAAVLRYSVSRPTVLRAWRNHNAAYKNSVR